MNFVSGFPFLCKTIPSPGSDDPSGSPASPGDALLGLLFWLAAIFFDS